MGEQNKILSRPIFRRDVSWDPFPNWTQPSRIYAQDFGLPPFLEPGDLEWLDWAKKRLASFSWPGYTQTPLLPLLSGQPPAAGSGKGLRQLTSGVSEVRTGQDSWKINLDVNHFSPEDITITTKEGYLQISGAACASLIDHNTDFRWIMWRKQSECLITLCKWTVMSFIETYWEFLWLFLLFHWKEIMKKGKIGMDQFQDASTGNISRSSLKSFEK